MKKLPENSFPDNNCWIFGWAWCNVNINSNLSKTRFKFCFLLRNRQTFKASWKKKNQIYKLISSVFVILKKKTYFNYYLIHLLQSRSNFFYLGEQSFKLLHQCIMICHHLKKCKQNVLFTYAGYKKIREIKLLHINFTKIV